MNFMKQEAKKHFKMKFVLVGIWVFLLFMIGNIAIGSSGSRLIQEIVGTDQSLKRAQGGMPVIVSKKEYAVSISPETIITDMEKPIIFIIVIANPFKDPLQFSLKDVRAYTEKKDIGILDSEEIIAEAREDFSKKNYKLNKEQQKALAPYIEDQMQRLRDKLLKTQTIAPKDQVMGLIYVQVPSGTEKLTIEVTLPKEKHEFSFHMIES